MAKRNKLAMLAVFDNGDIRQFYRRKGGGFTFSKKNSSGNRIRMIKKPAARRWAKKHGFKVDFTRKDFPFLIYDPTTGRVNRDLETRINEVGRNVRRYIWIGEGQRSDYQQWEFRMLYLRGIGNLAARCCLKYYPDRIHSWEECGKQSQSNHRWANAADAGALMWGKGNGSVDIGQVDGARKSMKEKDLCLPVPGEDWHIEKGNYWAA